MFNPGQGIAECFDSVGHTFPCFLTLGLVCLLDRLKSYTFQQSLCSTSVSIFLDTFTFPGATG